MDFGLILSSFGRALGQIGDPRFRRVLFLGIGLTIALLIAVTAAVMWGLGWLVGEDASLPWIGNLRWLDDAASVGGFFAMSVLSVFLMVPVASAISSLFLEEVADAVEDEHYPWLPDVPGTPIVDTVIDTLGFTGVLILANVLALILYLIFAPLAPLIFWGMNGFLLGREYFTLAAMRREGREGARRMRGRHMATIWAAGILMAIPLTVPFLNLVIPILGAATFTHIYNGIAADHRADPQGA
ncbi:EI24 domain-containing protein [Pseudooceanicola algae]|uniref:Uncharacterized protein n=1 Tax=Pseudooceanicola algae TaxID=1537215 RepID=A0A418SHY2_9RHOB|nr:EI24 domain-containing protein [Pseudooceanicola algae]QPM92092.1 hypothetical protein PSAL_033550 [Pseudooceanicola algae]